MLIGSFLLSRIKTYGGINTLNCAEMKMIIKLYISENCCDVKASHETALAITAPLPASEGKVLILNNLLLQESVDLPSVASLIQQSSLFSGSWQTTWGTYVLHLLQLKIMLMKYQPASVNDRANFGRLKLVRAIIFIYFCITNHMQTWISQEKFKLRWLSFNILKGIQKIQNFWYRLGTQYFV